MKIIDGLIWLFWICFLVMAVGVMAARMGYPNSIEEYTSRAIDGAIRTSADYLLGDYEGNNNKIDGDVTSN